MKRKLFPVVCAFIGIFYGGNAQSTLESGKISGNYQIEAQTYKKDSLIGAQDVSEKILSNSFLNLNYTNGAFGAGLRYEAYLNPILGIDPRYKGQGISYRYAAYGNDLIDVTVGDFYEQFGSGMIFRAYEERALGIDNAIDGIKFKLRPTKGVEVTGLVGKQRFFWDKGAGVIRGGDLNINLNDVLGESAPSGANITLGASGVSRYQADNNSIYYMPENVFAYSLRAGVVGSNYSVDAEYGRKINDPNAMNSKTGKPNYNPGYGFILNGSYFEKGFSFSLNLHKIDNMDFRGDRAATGTTQTLGFIPPLTKQHAYSLATFYPFSTQLNGEAGLQAELTYKFQPGSDLGGKYGTTLNINYSRVQSIDTTRKDEYTYDSPFFAVGDRLLFQDLNVGLSHKFSDKFKGSLTNVMITYDKDVLEAEGASIYGKVKADIIVLDGTYKINDNNAIKMEFQYMFSKLDSAVHDSKTTNGDWMMGLVEYTMAPSWYFTLLDQYNLGNDFEEMRIHYYSAAVAHIHENTRVSLSYGKQRRGILCVGGVCREVPASNGLYLSITSSF